MADSASPELQSGASIPDGHMPTTKSGLVWAEFVSLAVPGVVAAAGAGIATFGVGGSLELLRQLPIVLAPLIYGGAFVVGLAIDMVGLGFERHLMQVAPGFKTTRRKVQGTFECDESGLRTALAFYGQDPWGEIRRASLQARAARNSAIAVLFFAACLWLRPLIATTPIPLAPLLFATAVCGVLGFALVHNALRYSSKEAMLFYALRLDERDRLRSTRDLIEQSNVQLERSRELLERAQALQQGLERGAPASDSAADHSRALPEIEST